MKQEQGYIQLYLGDKAYVLQPTFETLSAAEESLDMGLVSMARKLADGMMTLEELSIIIKHCIAPNPLSLVTLDEIREHILTTGATQCYQAVALMFTLVFEGIGTLRAATGQ